MFCHKCKKDVQVWWGVCDICGFDITHPENNN
jgi:predicted amidophosphoribosyltransferase